MKRKQLIAVAACLSGVIVSTLASAAAWKRYTNERFGASAELPASGFVALPPPANGDGQTWRSIEDSSEITVFGSFLAPTTGWNDYRKSRTEWFASGETEITYRAGGDDWFVLSGHKNGRIVYLKVILSPHCDEQVANHLRVEYPVSRKAALDAVVTHMAASFRSEPGIQCS